MNENLNDYLYLKGYLLNSPCRYGVSQYPSVKERTLGPLASVATSDRLRDVSPWTLKK